ncbi:MAG TPA: TOMM precursor leader peptide-binding protein [Gaiellaceae bacterium]|jgi:bacteriocin biosynthesis cyclodehydratase domain-containing protein|nr:TOMM precursor leader peptide-binding protein [Gaiellaceae bacterium]
MNAAANLPELPLLAPWYRLVEEGEAVVLEHGHRAVVLEGEAAARLLPRLLPLLDGTRSVPDLLELVGPAAARAVEQALALLAAEGLLVAGPRLGGGVEAREAAERLAAASGLAPRVVRDRIAAARVGVVGAGGEEVARLLQRAGVGSVARGGVEGPPGEDGVVLVAPVADELELLEAWNAAALAKRVPWLQLLPFDGRFAAIGPLFLPGETACFACYRLRRAGCLGFGLLGAALEPVPTRAAAGPSLAAAAAAVAADHLLRWIGLRDAGLPGVLHALADGSGLHLDAHHVLRVPRCPACSTAAGRAPVAPWFEAVA